MPPARRRIGVVLGRKLQRAARDGTVSPSAGLNPINLPAVPVQIAIGSTHSCARTAAGDVYCWGEASTGQLGDGTPLSPQVANPKPTPQKALIDGVVEIACTLDSTIARRADGTIWQWGCSHGGPAGPVCASTPAPLPSFP
jgi:alpha-tubulin suppressor-like RCC1 family protein